MTSETICIALKGSNLTLEEILDFGKQNNLILNELNPSTISKRPEAHKGYNQIIEIEGFSPDVFTRGVPKKTIWQGHEISTPLVFGYGDPKARPKELWDKLGAFIDYLRNNSKEVAVCLDAYDLEYSDETKNPWKKITGKTAEFIKTNID